MNTNTPYSKHAKIAYIIQLIKVPFCPMRLTYLSTKGDMTAIVNGNAAVITPITNSSIPLL